MFKKGYIKNNAAAFTALAVLLLLAFVPQQGARCAGYLRDSTRVENSGEFYPENVSIEHLYSGFREYPLSFGNIFGIPEVETEFGKRTERLHFDFGNSGNIVITNALKDSIPYSVTDTVAAYQPDGKSVRGTISRIVIPLFQVFDTEYRNEEGTLADWRLFSTEPFKGLIGLKYLEGRSFTLDCKGKRLLVSSDSMRMEDLSRDSEIIPLLDFDYHPYGIHFRGSLSGREGIIYFDTGKSHTAVNRSLLPEEMIRSDRSGSFYSGTVEMKFQNLAIRVYYPRVKRLRRDTGPGQPIAAEVGIDILKKFLLTVDRAEGRQILIIHR